MLRSVSLSGESVSTVDTRHFATKNVFKTLPVAKQLEDRDILMAFKCIKGLAPPSLCNKFSTRSQVHTRNTRNKDKLHIPSFRSATGQRSFSYRAVQLWNDLPESLANIESFNVFKNAIKGRALDEFLSH